MKHEIIQRLEKFKIKFVLSGGFGLCLHNNSFHTDISYIPRKSLYFSQDDFFFVPFSFEVLVVIYKKRKRFNSGAMKQYTSLPVILLHTKHFSPIFPFIQKTS